MSKKKVYCFSWQTEDRRWHGSIDIIKDGQKDLTLKEWGDTAFEKYLQDAYNNILPLKLSSLTYLLGGEFILPSDVRKLSVFRIILDRREIDDGDSNSKTKEKIKKLLNLSMSSNKHEADTATYLAHKLMKKNSITREDLDEQVFISLRISPKGKRISHWEEYLYGGIGSISGVFSSLFKVPKNPIVDDIRGDHLTFTGRERDVLNASYLVECYIREIEKLVEAKRGEKLFSTKLVNDYRVGLIGGILERLKENKDQFFRDEGEKLYGIVPVDSRITEASDLFISQQGVDKTKVVDFGAYTCGKNDSENVIVRNAVNTEEQNGSIEAPND